MNKVTTHMRIAVHPIKAALWKERRKIAPGMPLREIGGLVGVKSPQQLKHHLEAMVKMGTIDWWLYWNNIVEPGLKQGMTNDGAIREFQESVRQSVESGEFKSTHEMFLERQRRAKAVKA